MVIRILISRTAASADQSPARPAAPGRVISSWPLLLLALPATVAIWSGWIGIGKLTGFGQVRPLPGIWNSLHLNTAITLHIGVEAYAAFALRAWLEAGTALSTRTRRFARWSAIGSLALGMTGQVAYHLLAQAHAHRAPWAVTTGVACFPVLVLGMGTALAHLLRADNHATDQASTSGAAQPGGGSAHDQASQADDRTGMILDDQMRAATAAARQLAATGHRGFPALPPSRWPARLQRPPRHTRPVLHRTPGGGLASPSVISATGAGSRRLAWSESCLSMPQARYRQ